MYNWQPPILGDLYDNQNRPISSRGQEPLPELMCHSLQAELCLTFERDIWFVSVNTIIIIMTLKRDIWLNQCENHHQI